MYTDWVNPRLVRISFSEFKAKKSPGPDGLRPIALTHLPSNFVNYITLAYKSALALSYTPRLWKRAKVIFIPKPGKADYQNPKSFRPISFSNYLLKGLERLCGWRMDAALVLHPLHNNQHGFRHDRGTDTALSAFLSYIESFLQRGEHSIGLFLDIKSAFDTMNPEHIYRSLIKHGAPPELAKWYYNYITHRDITYTSHGTEISRAIGVGFPQGGVLSAKFWVIAFNVAVEIINSHKVQGIAFADDCALVLGSTHLNRILPRLQAVTTRLTEWGRTVGLTFNPDKTIAVHFTRKRKTPPKQLQVDGKSVPYSSEVKYLGLTLDPKLQWRPHVKNKINKAKRTLFALSKEVRNNWGPKPHLMRWCYTGIVRATVAYAARSSQLLFIKC